MPLFDQILGAIANPNQQANPDQLGSILGVVNQVANSHGVDPTTTQTAVSVVGSYVRSALQQQRAAGANPEAIVNQYAGVQHNAGAVQALFNPSQQQQVAQAVAERTGLSADTVMAILPIIIPIALNLLKSGANNQPSATAAGAGGSNPVLNAFLDSDGDGDVDLGDTLSLAGRFLNQRG